jgi:hypothetical protein
MDGEDLERLTLEYLRAAAGEWRSLETGGAPIPLTDVYVLLEVVKRPDPRPLEPRPDLAPLPERLEHAGPSPPPQAQRAGDGDEAPVPLSRALREARHLVLLGEPGAGKTTTLQYIALWFAVRAGAAQAVSPYDRAQAGSPRHSLQTDLGIDEPCIPVRLDLRTLAGKLPATGAVLEEALAGEVDRFLRKGLETAQALVQAWRDSGRLLPLLDGLDEVPEGQREEVRSEVTRFARSPDGSRCRVVVTSRIAGYAFLGGDFKEFTLKPFQGEEARGYLAHWLAALRPARRREEAEREADRLLEEMRRTALRRLTDNPLLLRMAAELYAEKGEIARSRAELYRRWVEEEAWERARKRGAQEREKGAALDRLEEFAWALQNGLEEPELSEEEQQLLRDRLGLLVRLDSRLVFAHRTFQEYFAARRLARAWEENRPGAWAFLRPRLHLPDWREPLLILAGELEGPDAADLIRRVERAHRGLGESALYECYLRRDLLLALHLAGEARDLPAETRERLLARARRMWIRRGTTRDLKVALVRAAGALPSADALPALIGALEDENDWVRRAAAEALGGIGDRGAVPALIGALKDEKADVRQAAAGALGGIGDPRAVPALIGALKDEKADVRRAAVGALGGILGGIRPAAEVKERREQAALLRRTARALYRIRRWDEVYDPLRATLEKLEALTLRYWGTPSPLSWPRLWRGWPAGRGGLWPWGSSQPWWVFSASSSAQRGNCSRIRRKPSCGRIRTGC